MAKGYTLVELTIVVVVIGLMLALTMPRVQHSLVSDDLKAATRRMIGTVKTLRNNAVRDQRAYRLHFDMEASRLWVEWASMTSEEAMQARENASMMPEGIRILDVYRRGTGKKDMGDTAIHFTKKGYVEQAVIHLGSDNGRAHTIVLSPFLDTIKTYDKYLEIETMLDSFTITKTYSLSYGFGISIIAIGFLIVPVTQVDFSRFMSVGNRGKLRSPAQEHISPSMPNVQQLEDKYLAIYSQQEETA